MDTQHRFLPAAFIGLLLVAGAVPAEAQCPSAREFSGLGYGGLTHRIKIFTGEFPNDGNEFGSLWVLGSPTIHSGGPHFPGPDLCPESTNDWYTTGGMFLGMDSGIQGFIASPLCQMTACPPPGATHVTLVEDVSADGTDAAFILYAVDETPPDVRWWDHARTGDSGGGAVPAIGEFTTHVLHAFPKVDVTSSSCFSFPVVQLSVDYTDVAINVHAVNAPGNTPLPASVAIVSYQILGHHGPVDPGRVRTDWNLGVLQTLPYADGPINGAPIDAPCPTVTDDTFLAVGIEYESGIESVLVGASTGVECDCTIADPDDDKPTLKTRRQLLGADGL